MFNNKIESNLTHVYNLLTLTAEQLENIIDSGDCTNLNAVMSAIVMSKDAILDQIDELTTLTIQDSDKKIA